MTVTCGPVTMRPRPELQLIQYVCACGYCCATIDNGSLTAGQEARIVATFNSAHLDMPFNWVEQE